MQVHIIGTYKKYKTKNETNEWGVYIFINKQTGCQVQVVGVPTCALIEKAEYQITGIEKFSIYGKQIRLQSIDFAENPTTFLLAKYIKGIGPKTAQKLYKHLGPACLQTLFDQPSIVEQLTFISKSQRAKIREALQTFEEYDTKLRLLIIAYFHGDITVRQIEQIVTYCKYGESSGIDPFYDVVNETMWMRWAAIRENPYLLIDVLPSFKFKRADTLARRAGVPYNANIRFRAAVLYSMDKVTSYKGSVCLTNQEICSATATNIMSSSSLTNKRKALLAKAVLQNIPYHLNSEDEKEYVMNVSQAWEILQTIVDEDLKKPLENRKIVKYGEDYYLARDFNRELYCSVILRCLSQSVKAKPISQQQLEQDLAVTGIPYTDEQKAGIINALKYPISILTGGPGTGKTSVLRAVVEISGLNHAIMLSPTGKAAERMSAVTVGGHAMTIHRFCAFVKSGKIPKPEDQLIIIDEASMIGQHLLYELLNLVGTSCDFFFIGDVNQLPSIDKGKVLEDMIESGQIPVTRLTKCLRSNNSIDQNADFILKCHPSDTYIEDQQSEWIEIPKETDKAYVISKVLEQYDKLTDTYGDDQTCILVPYRKSKDYNIVTTTDINLALHKRNAHSALKGMYMWTIGDRIIIQNNCYNIATYSAAGEEEKGIFNGDTGTVINLDGQRINILFDNGRTAWLTADEMENNADYGYAITIHKSQGSEYSAVLVLAEQKGSFVTKKMLYTAVSRPREKLVVMAYEHAVDQIVNNDFSAKRRTHLMRLNV